METWVPLIQHSLLYGAFLSAVLTVIVLGSLAYNAELWLQDYPADIRARYGPASERTRRQKPWIVLLFFIPLLALLVLSIVQLRALVGSLSFLQVFVHVYTMLMVFNLVDLVLIDWFIIGAIRPRFVTLAGTEGMAGYNDWGLPLRGFFKGSLGLLVFSAIMAGVAVLL